MIVSPSLASRPPQHGHAVGAGITTRSRGRCSGKGVRTGFLRVKLVTMIPQAAPRREGSKMHVPVTDLTRSVRPCLGETRRLFALTRWVPGVYAWSALSSTFNERIGNGIDRD